MRLVDADELRKKAVPHTRGERAYCADIKKWAVLIADIDESPTIDAEPVKHGVWLPQIVLGTKAWDCSECKTLGSPHWKRCPVCEAKMDGERKET